MENQAPQQLVSKAIVQSALYQQNQNAGGLSKTEAADRLLQYGINTLRLNEGKRLPHILAGVAKEPMFLLLCAACLLYFLLGETAEGFMTVAALFFVAAISVYQEVRSSRALAALQNLTEPKAIVMRDGGLTQISVALLVPGDVILLTEGEKVPADAVILEANDLSLNEAILTGEALPVEKSVEQKIFQGTVVNSGKCTAQVSATGNRTELGKIGVSITTYVATTTDLQRQVSRLVRQLALFGAFGFALIFFVNFWYSHEVIPSLLFGLTLVMSAIPEEIPVAFSSFMALGAYALSKLGIITRQPQTIENLGAVDVICLDKTGTITANEMSVDELYHFPSRNRSQAKEVQGDAAAVLRFAWLASEASPFDAMEKAISHAYYSCEQAATRDVMVKEYPLSGRPPMMTHVYADGNGFLATAKGAVERVIAACRLNDADKQQVLELAKGMAAKGRRVLGVASAQYSGSFPQSQEDFAWRFEGLLSLYDPPKPFVKDVLQQFYNAGISVALLTGDYRETAESIANEVGLQHNGKTVSGDEVMAMAEDVLRQTLGATRIFSRMYPEAKRKVINALKAQGCTVAMTGDGVNDGPALKVADIGIAVGKTGSEVARQSADLILTDDDLRSIAEAVRQGRRIFSNLKKAVRYIISIHIPIILVASLPVLLHWQYPNIFTPIHVIFLELIMGPTCSIFFEREPAEPLLMQQPPRKKATGLFERRSLLLALLQGGVIALGALVLFYSYSAAGASFEKVRTLVFTFLIVSNIFLTFVDRSLEEHLAKTLRYKNSLALPVVIVSLVFLALLHFVLPIQSFFGLAPITFREAVICLLTTLLCVGWFELYKLFRGQKAIASIR